jgi:hypothetical protein
MDHLERVRQEFSRQADAFAASAAITDEQLTARLVDAIVAVRRGRRLFPSLAHGPRAQAALSAQRS